MGVARGVKWWSNLTFDQIWSCHISNRRYRRVDYSGDFFCRNRMITSSKMAVERSKGRSCDRDLKILLHRNRLANDGQTSQLWFMGEAFSNLLKSMSSLIQDGHRLKIAQILKKSSHEPPDRFRRNFAGLIDQSCCLRFVKMPAPGYQMGVARGSKFKVIYFFCRKWSCYISNRRY